MKLDKILQLIALSLFLLAIKTTCFGSETEDLPPWVNELRSNAAESLQVDVKVSRINAMDNIEKREHLVIRLQGEGSLNKVSSPFDKMSDQFLSNGWTEDWTYGADGHGSSSIAFRKQNYLCIFSVWIDSGDDESNDHVPSMFWFSIDCRESSIAEK